MASASLLERPARNMEIRTEIEIAASGATVWKILTDFARYPEWNPFIVKIQGEIAPDARLSVTLSLPETGTERTFRPRIVHLEAEQELRWRGHLWVRGLFDGEHFFRLSGTESGGTRLVHGENFSGLLVRGLIPTLTRTTRGFVYMNEALKRRAEGKTSAA